MAKIKFNVKGVETRSGYGEPIPKGMYVCDIETCLVNKPQGKDERIEVVYVICDGDYKGRKLFDYINLESDAAAFKVREFLEAVGLVTGKKESGDFDPEKLIGDKVQIRVAHQPDNRPEHAGEIQSRVGSTHPLSDSDEEGEDLDSDEEGDDEVDLDEFDRAELKKFIKEQDLEISVKKSMSDDDIRKAIAETMSDGDGEEADEEADDDEENDDEEGEDEIDLDELDRAGLKALIKEHKLDITVKKSHEDDDIRKLIAEAMGAGAADYSDLSVDDLKATLKERGLSEKGTKKIMIARLEKDDESSKSSKDPF